MSIKKLVAANMAEGLRKVKDEFGVDALILRSVKRNGKVELFVEAKQENEAADDYELAEAALRQAKKSRGEAVAEPEDALAFDVDSAVQNNASDRIREEYRNAKYRMLNAIGDQVDAAPVRDNEPAGQTQSHSHDANIDKPYSASFDQILGSINNTSRGLERTVSTILEGLALDAEVAGRVRGARRVDELVHSLKQLVATDKSPASGIKAFVGPSGSGKTTSLIKLVTRRVMQFGANNCAIINCDRYRAGANQQLDRIAKLLDVEVIHLRSGEDLKQAITRVKHREFIAIDMPGLSMSDNNLGYELTRLQGTGFNIERYLVLPANLQASVMHRAAAIYGQLGATTCIFTRLDETDCLGGALSFLVKRNISLAYTTHGTHIPEDIRTARSGEFIDQAIQLMDKQGGGILPSEFAKTPISDLTNRDSEMDFHNDLHSELHKKVVKPNMAIDV